MGARVGNAQVDGLEWTQAETVKGDTNQQSDRGRRVTTGIQSAHVGSSPSLAKPARRAATGTKIQTYSRIKRRSGRIAILGDTMSQATQPAPSSSGMRLTGVTYPDGNTSAMQAGSIFR